MSQEKWTIKHIQRTLEDTSEQYLQFFKSLTIEDKSLIYEFTDNYEEVNASLRANPDQYFPIMELFEKAPPITKTIITWRATDYPPPDGENITLNGIVFTTTDSSMRNSPVSDTATLLRVYITSGAKVLLWNETDESEVLINHRTVAKKIISTDEYMTVEATGDILHPVKNVYL